MSNTTIPLSGTNISIKKHSLCVIIPMYNEEKGAAVCIDRVISEIRHLKSPITLLIVNDGSTDQTTAILNQKKKEYSSLIVIHDDKNQGYGKALQTGIQEAAKREFDYVLFMDSDLTNDPKYIVTFANYMKRNIDCVNASRYINGGKVIGVPFFRRIISIIGNYIASVIINVGIKDCTNGFRMVRLSLLKNTTFHENSFPIIMEELYSLKKNHAHFAEIPVTLTARADTKSHFTYKPRIFYDYAKYVIKSAFIS